MDRPDWFRVSYVLLDALYVVYALWLGYNNSLLGFIANLPVERDIAINMLNDVATVSGILVGFVSVLAGDNLSTILHARIDREADTPQFRHYVHDRIAFLAMDSIYIAGFVTVALWSILALLNVTGSNNRQSLVYGPLEMLLAVSITLILRILIPFFIVRRRGSKGRNLPHEP